MDEAFTPWDASVIEFLKIIVSERSTACNFKPNILPLEVNHQISDADLISDAESSNSEAQNTHNFGCLVTTFRNVSSYRWPHWFQSILQTLCVSRGVSNQLSTNEYNPKKTSTVIRQLDVFWQLKLLTFSAANVLLRSQAPSSRSSRLI